MAGILLYWLPKSDGALTSMMILRFWSEYVTKLMSNNNTWERERENDSLDNVSSVWWDIMMAMKDTYQ